jgi:hypothetical protein
MQDDDLVVVKECASVQEASLVQSALEADGISSCVGGAETATTLWYYGTALGGVKVLTARKNVASANEVLSSRNIERSQSAEWTCRNCRNTVDAGFEVCWSCGDSIDEIQDGSNTEGTAEPIAADDAAEVSAANDDSDQPAAEINELEQRVFRSAIFGLLFFPLFIYSVYLLFLYSIYLLLRQTMQGAKHRTSWRFAAAVAINVTAFVVWWTLFSGWGL